MPFLRPHSPPPYPGETVANSFGNDPLDRDSFDQGPQAGNDFNPFISPTSEESRDAQFLNRTDEKLNPWFSMWLRPRATVRQKLDTDPKGQVLLLAALGGISGLLGNANLMDASLNGRVADLAGLIIIGGIVGIVGLYFMGWLLRVSGRMLGGQAIAMEVRTAQAWSNIPGLWMLLIYVPFVIWQVIQGSPVVFGSEEIALLRERGGIYSPEQPTWLLLLTAMGVIVGLWQVVVSSQAIGEAHQFSSSRGFFSLMLAGLLLTGVVLVVSLLVGLVVVGLVMMR